MLHSYLNKNKVVYEPKSTRQQLVEKVKDICAFLLLLSSLRRY